MNIRAVFTLLVVAGAFMVAFELAPVLYKGYVTVPGVCKEAVDQYKKYGPGYVIRDINERLDSLAVPRDRREVRMARDEETVYVTITYTDQVDFWGYYRRTFHFRQQCDSPVASVNYRKYKYRDE